MKFVIHVLHSDAAPLYSTKTFRRSYQLSFRSCPYCAQKRSVTCLRFFRFDCLLAARSAPSRSFTFTLLCVNRVRSSAPTRLPSVRLLQQPAGEITDRPDRSSKQRRLSMTRAAQRERKHEQEVRGKKQPAAESNVESNHIKVQS